MRRDATVALIAGSPQEDLGAEAARHAAEEKIAECDTKLARYRSALEAGTDPAIASQWIWEMEADRALARAQLDEHADAPQQLEATEIAAQLDQIGDIGAMIRDADRKAKADLYAGLELRLTYHPVKRIVRAEANLNSHDMYKRSCPRGDSTVTYMPLTLSADLSLDGW